MSIAYKNRKKAIKRKQWSFGAQIQRQVGKLFRPLTAEEKHEEAAKGFKPGQKVTFPRHVRVGAYYSTRHRVGRPNSHRLGRRFPKWALQALRG